MQTLLIFSVAVTMAIVGPTNLGHAGSGTSPQAAPRTAGPDGTAAGTSAWEAWRSGAFAHIKELEYHVSRSEEGLQAPNRSQDLRTFFRRDHIEVVPRRSDETPPWRFRWRTDRWGRWGHWTGMEASTRAVSSPVADGRRVSYSSPGLTEWYENRPEGIEQGFTVDWRPPGDGPLRIEGVIGASLRAEATGDAVDFYDPNDVHILHYDGLHVWDAEGDVVEASFQATDGRVAIVVRDGGAAYPLTIDPVFSNPIWIGTGGAEDEAYGFAVATAGDVNADGFSDVLVSAVLYDGAFSNQGAVFLYLGSAAGLSSTPDWTGLGAHAAERYGWDVQTAGDVNGDGFDDVIVGAIYHETTLFKQGRAYLYHGSGDGLSETADWTVDGEVAEELLGTAVGTAGDVNDDGYGDVIVGAAEFEGSGEGRAYLFYGSAGGLSVAPVWTVDGSQASSRLGYRAGTAGDVNADGYGDVFVSAYRHSNGEMYEGQVWVFHGSSGGLGPVPDWVAEGNQEWAWFGRGAGMAGDVNGDGYGDLVVGAPYYDYSSNDQGAVYIYTGSAAGLTSTPFWTSYGLTPSSEWGLAVGTAGDVNGDGLSDVVIGGPGYQSSEGLAGVYRGSASGMVLAGFGQGSGGGSRYGESVATAGDVDGDGFSDVIIGSWRSDEGGPDFGAAFAYRGSPAGLSASAAWTAESNDGGANFGYSLSDAGDVNGDGFDDAIVGAPFFDGGAQNTGAAFLFAGSANGLSLFPVWLTIGAHSAALHGYSVSGAGDVNGDGFDDLIVGASNHDHGNGVRGAASVYHGSASGPSNTPDWMAGAELESESFGSAVSGAGDVNGDGFADVIVGAPDHSGGQESEGAAYVFLGSESGLEPAPIWSVESNQADANMGHSVAGAGDVNGDGFADIVVGAIDFSAGQNEEGAAFLYNGAPAGPEAFPSWGAEGQQDFAHFGSSTSTAGDVNGDGYSDLIVGAYNFSNQHDGEGRAFLYMGSPAGLNVSSSWTGEPDEEYAAFGHSVSTAGDINGDGYSDVVIGAPYYQGIALFSGRAYVFHGSPSDLLTLTFIADGSQENGALGWAVGSAGDVNGDGFSDVLIAEIGFNGGEDNEGAAHLYYGNGGDGRLLLPQQRRTDDSAPIALGGLSDSPSSFLVTAVGRSAQGRAEVRMEVEAKPDNVPFDGTGTFMTESFDTGLTGVNLDQLVTGLEPEAAYRWRLRIVTDSPHFPRSPWFSPQGNAPTELDLRTPGGSASVDPAALAESGIHLSPARPNPFRSSTSLTFEIAETRHGRVAIYDVAGRRVALLTDRLLEPGRHNVTWDGRTDGGADVAEGIYFARLNIEGSVRTRSLVLLR